MASAHHQPQHQRYSMPTHNDRRLPSLKDLNFQYRPPSQQESPSSIQSSGTVDHQPPNPDHSIRHAPPAWGRPNTGQPPMSPHHHQHIQHSPPPAVHQSHPSQKQIDYASKHDNAGYLTPGMPLSAQMTPVPGSVSVGPGARGDELPHSQNSLKRPRAGSSMGVPDGHPSHPPYPPHYTSYPSQQPAYHQVQPATQPAHEQMHPGPGPSSHPGYAYQQQYMQTRHPQQHPHHQSHPQPHLHPHQQQQAPSNPYPPAPQPQDPWEHHRTHHQHHPQQQHQPPPPPPPQHAHQPHLAFARTTPIVPTNLDTRPPPFSPNDLGRPSARESTVAEIVKHCTALYSFASRYAQLQGSMPHVQPPPAELSSMTQRAGQVVRLLEVLRRMTMSEAERLKLDVSSGLNSSDDHRPPKRPWEDLSHDGVEGGTLPENYANSGDKPQTTAEQDMELIRTKRATSTAAGAASSGLPKSKYRKRSRATPPGKCHSCNIRETPEWRRGPDGARTLCNACGLHYAKLMRKRDKALGPNADVPNIDMDTLRASTRANDIIDKNIGRSSKQPTSQSQSADESTSPAEHAKPLPQQPPPPLQQHHHHHQGSFQLVPVMPTNGPPPNSDLNRVHGQQGQSVIASQNTGAMPVPPPPWATAASPGGRGYAPDQLQHQSFMRTSHHPTPNGTSPR